MRSRPNEDKGLYEPFDRLQDPDPATRRTLAKVIAATTGAALPVYITINNKVEDRRHCLWWRWRRPCAKPARPSSS